LIALRLLLHVDMQARCCSLRSRAPSNEEEGWKVTGGFETRHQWPAVEKWWSDSETGL